MRCCLIQLATIFLALQCIQATLRDTNRSIKQHTGGIELLKTSLRPSSRGDTNDDQEVHELSKLIPATLPHLRSSRQNTGTPGDPESYSYHFNDNHQYARVNYLGEGSKVIFLLTYDKLSSSTSNTISSNLYRSTDYGRTFQNQHSKLQSGFRLHSIIYRFQNSKTVMFADTSRLTLYVTTDEGQTFRSYRIPVNPRTLKIHPTMPGWILGHDSDQGILMYSKDSGASWDTVAQDIHPRYYSRYSIYDFTWGIPGVDWDINNPYQSDISKVFYTVRNLTTSSSSYNNRILHTAQNCGDGYTSKVLDYNLGYTSTVIFNGNYIFAAKFKGIEVEVYVSYKRRPFKLTRIPTTFSNYFYFVGTHRSSQALFIVEHDAHYSLYLSDETGIYFTLSLEDIVVDDSKSAVDLQIIDITNGTMMANQFTSRVDGSQYNQTLITFDNGAQWQKIQAPAIVNGVPSNCVLPQCSLHFHMGTSSDYTRIGVYSRDSAPGIIVAHGNTGSYLTDTGTVYITRDGGLSWEQTLDSTWHIEIIDHGGLLVAAKDNHQDYSRTIKYSCDEGMSWSDFDFINSSIVIWGIVTEPGETTTQVLLLGTISRSTLTWITTHINFTSIFLRTCETSDYYQWTVSDGRIGDQQCLLGETRIIERRQPSVCCWNSRQYERLISVTPCECTAADFECEWGYRRDDHSGNCILDLTYGPNLDCLTGYRKIAGDVCFRGVSAQYLPPSDCMMDNRDDSSVFNICVMDTDNFTRSNDSVMDNDNSTRSNDSVIVTDKADASRYNNSVRKTDDANDSGSTVAISVSVIVVVITIATLTMLVLVIIFIVKKRNKTSSFAIPIGVTNNVIPNIYEEAPAHATVTTQAPTAKEATVYTNYKSLKEQEIYDV